MENLINLSTSASDERNEVISNSNDKVSSISKHLGGIPKQDFFSFDAFWILIIC